MHDLDGRSILDRIDEADDATFGDLVYEQLKNAPWIACSIGVHVVIGILVMLFAESTHEPEVAKQVVEVKPLEDIPELEEDVPPEVEETKPIDEQEKVVEDPVIKDAKVSDHNETDNDMETEESLGDPRFNSDAPFQGPGTNGTIGVGGGAGGAFGGRRGGHRNLKAGGGGKKTETAVDLALEWLKRHQSEDGRWEADNYERHCKGPKNWGPGEAAYTPGVSGLAMLCFLGYGETHQQGHYKDVVKRGLKYLKGIQDAEGCFGPRTSQHFQYNNSIAALAMCEAYGLTSSRLFKDSAQRAVNFVHQSQNPYMAWRYGVRDGDNDTSVTGWMVMVLKSAKMADLEVDMTAMKGAVAWVDKMTEREFGRIGYQQRGGQPARHTEMMDKFPADQSESLTAVGLTTRIFAGQDPDKEPMMNKHADLLVKKLPNWDIDSGEIDMYYWYYGTLAMFQMGGAGWKKWNEAMKTSIVDNQITEQGICARGSWDPIGPWGPDGGRVYSTSTMCLCLEVYYRYGKVFGTYSK